MEYFKKALALVEAHPWIALCIVGLLNEIAQRYPKLRANSLFQILPNMLKLTPLGKLPGIGRALEVLDTPDPPKAPLDSKP